MHWYYVRHQGCRILSKCNVHVDLVFRPNSQNRNNCNPGLYQYYKNRRSPISGVPPPPPPSWRGDTEQHFILFLKLTDDFETGNVVEPLGKLA